MLFSRTWQYAMRLLAHLARLPPGEQIGARALATAAEVPGEYAAKILGTLARGGLVRARRGPGGGVQLARPAAAISLADVARGLGEGVALDECVLGHLDCSDAEPCAVRPTWRRLVESILGRTLDELSGLPMPSAVLLAPEAAADSGLAAFASELGDELL